MSDFKAGDDVWFFYTTYGKNASKYVTTIFPSETQIHKGFIVDILDKDDLVYIYMKDEKELITIGWPYFEEWVYKTKQEALDAMIKSLQDMKEE